MRQYAATLTSNLFRLVSYVFLRIIPHSRGPYILPTLYFTYLFFWLSEKEETQHLNVNGTSHKSHKERKHTNHGHKNKTSILNAASTLLFSLPSSIDSLRRTNLLINSILLVFAAEFVLTPLLDPAHDVTFARVGAVYPDGAKVHVRYPFAHTNVTSVKVVYRLKSKPGVNLHGKWSESSSLILSKEHDWSNTTLITALWPSSDYEYKLVLADDPHVFLPYPREPLPLRTFPDPNLQSGTHFRFISTSCILPNFPYIPGHSRQLKGFDLLADYLWPTKPDNDVPTEAQNKSSDSRTQASSNESTLSPIPTPYTSNDTEPSDHKQISQSPHSAEGIPVEFMLFLGDFIYADIPAYFGDDKDAYRRFYRRNYNSPSFRKVYEKLPIVHIYDDHEFIDNFYGMANDSKAPFVNASSAFKLYNMDANYDPVSNGKNYFTFRYGDAAFFVLDTRRYRSGTELEDPNASTMLGSEQLTALHNWLGAVNQTSSFKFIVSSVPFSSLWAHDAAIDSWAGYEPEKTALLKVLHTIPNVVILSGDRHEFAAIEYNTDTVGARKVLEFSTSPLNMFYVPVYHTLNQESKEHVEVVETNEAGEKIAKLVPKERVVKYIPEGSHKWAAIEVDSRNASAPILKVDILVEGRKLYTHVVVGEAVHRTSALGTYIPNSVKNILNNIGLKPDTWF